MRTITKEIKAYKFSELSDEAQESVRQGYVEFYLDSTWWEWTYDSAEQAAELMGIAIKDIYFSGFWSQGDGACYEGTYDYEEHSWASVLDEFPQDKELISIARRMEIAQLKSPGGKISASITQSGNYSHSGTMRIETSNNDELVTAHQLELETEITEGLIEFADWIYKRLKKEYEYLTSTEEVEARCEESELEFEEDGTEI